LQSEIEKTKQSLTAAKTELDNLKQDLAEEKFNRVTAEAELDATKNKKPDTSEVDALRKELKDLKTEHLASMSTAQQTHAAATKEHFETKTSLDETKIALEKLQARLAKEQVERKSDFDDMHSSLTQVCEEATKKASDAEAKLEIASSKVADVEARLKEAEAIIKVKDAELAEAKVSRDSQCTAIS